MTNLNRVNAPGFASVQVENGLGNMRILRDQYLSPLSLSLGLE